MYIGGGPLVGILMKGAPAGELVTVSTAGGDEHPPESGPAQDMMALLATLARQSGVPISERFMFHSAQVFFRQGQPSEVRVLWGEQDGPATLFKSTFGNLPRWTDAGEFLPEDRDRSHMAARVEDRPGGPVLVRSWDMKAHGPSGAYAWATLAALTAQDYAPDALRAAIRRWLDPQRATNEAARLITEDGAGELLDRFARRAHEALRVMRRAVGLDSETAPEDEDVPRIQDALARWMRAFSKSAKDEAALTANDVAELKDFWGAWSPEPDRDPPRDSWVLRKVLRLVWDHEIRAACERAHRIPAAAMPAFLARTTTAAGHATSATRDTGGRLVTLRAFEWNFAMPAAALVDVATELGGVASAPKATAAVAAYLTIRVWERFRAGELRWDYVPMPAGRDDIRRWSGADYSEADLDAALEWLGTFRCNGHPCVASFHAEKVQQAGGGRPPKARLVHVGAPLAPMGLERVYTQAGIALPAALRWYSPVLPPDHAPLVGNRQTHERQRAAFTLALGAVLIDLREQYANRGIRLVDLRRPLMDSGIYHRSHASLVEDLFSAWTRPPDQALPFVGVRTGPVLVEVDPGSGLYRLGPDYTDADRMLRLAAEKTSDGRERRERQRNARGRADRKGRPGPV